jgi:uncharacterized membrane protein
MQENDRKIVSHHILPTSANLLGLCFILISSLSALGVAGKTIIDDVAAICIVVFLFSCIFSYASMRTQKKSDLYEKIADIIFMLGLGLITILSCLLIFELVR